MIDSILFDLDGTLWDSTQAICKTWNIILNDYTGIREPIEHSEIEKCMGLLLDDISCKLFPNETPAMQKQLIDKCCDLEVEYLAKYGGNLYPKLEATLAYLSNKYKLFIVSNCQSGYIESFFKGHGLKKYFTDFECAGNTGMQKGDNNKLIIQRNNLLSPVYVGDTAGDLLSARVAGIPFVYAKYGFGSVNEYEYAINKFEELTDIF